MNKPPTWSANTLFAPNKANPLLPAFNVGGGTPFFVAADASNLPWYNSNPIINVKDNEYTRGRHSLKFGFFLDDYRKNEQFGFETQGSMSFFSGTPISTGNGLADTDLGLIGAYQEGTQMVTGRPIGGYPKGHWRLTDFEPYIHNDWKVTRKLTLNLGVRYYLFSRIHDVSNPTVDSNFLPNLYDPAKQAHLDASGNLVPSTGQTYLTYGNGLVACGTGGIPKGCSLPTHSTLAPRFGFAYDLGARARPYSGVAMAFFTRSGMGTSPTSRVRKAIRRSRLAQPHFSSKAIKTSSPAPSRPSTSVLCPITSHGVARNNSAWACSMNFPATICWA